MKKYDSLKLENQLCFPLYAAGKEIVRKYHPVLEKLNITYTQYITLLVLWEQDGLSVKELGKKLYLDSGTLTPLLKALETKGFVKRVRNSRDERLVEVFLTDEGRALREEALSVPLQVGQCVALSKDEAMQLYSLLYKLLGNLTNEGDNNE
ncbi:MAG: MarR family transcriptional regulator [Clostridia bacterium]|nr:MarR family transcriptional regulator [Clostridia bacterium]MBR5772979.1 MarR family transcriptional regulator [Clostridia bacterium]